MTPEQRRQKALSLVEAALQPLVDSKASGLFRDALEAAREVLLPPRAVSDYHMVMVSFGDPMSRWASRAEGKLPPHAEWLGPWAPCGLDRGRVLWARPYSQREPVEPDPRAVAVKDVVIGVLASRIRDGHVLLTQRKANDNPLLSEKWGFPGGKVEPGESHEQALQREFREEVSCDVDVGQCLLPKGMLFEGHPFRVFPYEVFRREGSQVVLTSAGGQQMDYFEVGRLCQLLAGEPPSNGYADYALPSTLPTLKAYAATRSIAPGQVDAAARAAHEANRAWCLAHGDTSQKSYDDAEEWQRESARRGVAVALKGATPEQQHAAWMEDKLADGWVYGETKSSEAKTHPCLIPYLDLPPEQRAKDSIYAAVVRAFAAAFAAEGKE